MSFYLSNDTSYSLLFVCRKTLSTLVEPENLNETSRFDSMIPTIVRLSSTMQTAMFDDQQYLYDLGIVRLFTFRYEL
jgi:hypothetical protein